MNSLLYYYNNVQKIAAYRQAKRMQRGVISGFRQPIVNASSTKFTMPPINIGTSDFSFEYFGNSSNVLSQATAIYFIYNGDPLIVFSGINGGNGILAFTIAEKTTVLNWEAGSIDELFHIVLSREGKSISLYVNGQKLSGFETSEVIDFGDISFMFSNASNLGLIRMWNYALSADEIATLDNNGDPMGYVVPKTMKDRSEFSLTGTTSYTWIGNDDPTYLKYIPLSNSLKRGSVYRISVTISDYESGDPFVHVNRVYSIPASNGTYTIYARPALENNVLYISGGYQNTDRRLTLTVNSIIPVGILAEYLPQNLMYSKDDKTIATSWLDSAKQMPLSDEYMEPLFQSIGGYDMAANGAPEILYNE